MGTSGAGQARRGKLELDNNRHHPESEMKLGRYLFALYALTALSLWADESVSPGRQFHQAPDRDGVYYVGPEVTAPRMIRTVYVPYPNGARLKDIQGMTAMAMVIDAKGAPQHIQLLHSHGDAFDQAALAAVNQSKFAPGTLDGKPVPVWIDVRVVFWANRAQTVPEVLITERDLPPPPDSQFEDKHHKPLSYTPPIAIHTVDADFTDPFTRHPFVQVAVVTVLVGQDGLPKEVRTSRGLGFGLDEKAAAAVWHYKFLPATNKGKPVDARRNIMVNFAKF